MNSFNYFNPLSLLILFKLFLLSWIYPSIMLFFLFNSPSLSFIHHLKGQSCFKSTWILFLKIPKNYIYKDCLEHFLDKSVWVRVWSTPRHTRDVKNGTYCCFVWHVTLIVRVGGGIHWPINRRNSISCTFRTSGQRSCNQRIGYLLNVT